MNDELKTIPQLSRLLRLSQKQIRDYVAEGCPVAIRGTAPNPHQINTADFFHWCLAKRDADNRLKKKASAGPIDEAKARSSAAAASIKELELAERRGDLFHLWDWAPFVDEKMLQTRIEFVPQFPDKFRDRFADEAPAGLLKRQVRFISDGLTAILNRMGAGMKAIPDEVKAADAGGGKRRS